MLGLWSGACHDRLAFCQGTLLGITLPFPWVNAPDIPRVVRVPVSVFPSHPELLPPAGSHQGTPAEFIHRRGVGGDSGEFLVGVQCTPPGSQHYVCPCV